MIDEADAIADQLAVAELDVKAISALTDARPDLDISGAYAIQDALLARRRRLGDKLIGIKLGLTSAQKQRQMNVDSPLTGWLTSRMMWESGAPLPRTRLIHPRVEPEIVFLMGSPLRGPGVTRDQALAAVSHVTMGVEVLDSRFVDFRFTLPDVIADNASSALFMSGAFRRVDEHHDLAAETVEVVVEGNVVATGSGADVLDHPANALAHAANDLASRGHTIEPGWIVLTGGITEAVPAEPGRPVTFRFGQLGTITVD